MLLLPLNNFLKLVRQLICSLNIEMNKDIKLSCKSTFQKK